MPLFVISRFANLTISLMTIAVDRVFILSHGDTGNDIVYSVHCEMSGQSSIKRGEI